jgi:excisionase family DNA binding protein
MTPPGGARTGGGDPLVMSVVEAARLLGISKTLAYDLVARQELPSLRLGGRVRVPRRAIERLTESRTKPSPDVPRSPRKGSGRRPERAPAPAAPAGAEDGLPTQARAPRSNRRDPDPQSTTQLSLFEIPLQPPTPSDTIPTAPPPTSTPTEPDPYRTLKPSNEPDALAPGVRRDPVNVAGNRAGGRSALNGNLNGQAGSGC